MATRKLKPKQPSTPRTENYGEGDVTISELLARLQQLEWAVRLLQRKGKE